jgi:hypothetical protein
LSSSSSVLEQAELASALAPLKATDSSSVPVTEWPIVLTLIIGGLVCLLFLFSFAGKVCHARRALVLQTASKSLARLFQRIDAFALKRPVTVGRSPVNRPSRLGGICTLFGILA